MTTNGTKKKPRPQSDLELATMKHCRNLIMRLSSPMARHRVVQYLSGACHPESEAIFNEPAEVVDPRQMQLPAAPGEDVFE